MTKSYGVGVKKVNSDVLFDTGPPSVEQRPCRWCDQRSRGTKKATGWWHHWMLGHRQRVPTNSHDSLRNIESKMLCFLTLALLLGSKPFRQEEFLPLSSASSTMALAVEDLTNRKRRASRVQPWPRQLPGVPQRRGIPRIPSDKRYQLKKKI